MYLIIIGLSQLSKVAPVTERQGPDGAWGGARPHFLAHIWQPPLPLTCSCFKQLQTLALIFGNCSQSCSCLVTHAHISDNLPALSLIAHDNTSLLLLLLVKLVNACLHMAVCLHSRSHFANIRFKHMKNFLVYITPAFDSHLLVLTNAHL